MTTSISLEPALDTSNATHNPQPNPSPNAQLPDTPDSPGQNATNTIPRIDIPQALLLRTPRLQITRYNPANLTHASFLVDLHIQTADGVRPRFTSAEQAMQHMRNNEEEISRTGFGQYLVSLLHPATGMHHDSNPNKRPQREEVVEVEVEKEEQPPPLPIGSLSLRTRPPPNPPAHPDVGFGFLPAHQGKGYATEAARALLDFYAERGVERVYGFCDHKNMASRGVLKKLGFVGMGDWELGWLGGLVAEGWERGLRA